MPNYTLVLREDLPATSPSALDVRYDYRNGTQNTWPVVPVGQDYDTNKIVVTGPAAMGVTTDVLSRKLVAHYPTAPITREFVISTVSAAALEGAALAAPGDTATNYSVTIAMNQTTVGALSSNKFNLYGFKAVKSTGAGAPLVWFATTSFGLSTVVWWAEHYQAYTSTSQIISGGTVNANNSHPIGLNNTLNVTDPTGTGTVDTTTGVTSAITLNNETTTQFTCGISQSQPNGTITPMCAFPLFGVSADVIAPIEQVLLMFSTTPVNTGTVIEQAYSAGLLIDLTAENARNVRFDINASWSWDGSPWAVRVSPNQSLVPLLIQSSPSLGRSVLSSLR